MTRYSWNSTSNLNGGFFLLTTSISVVWMPCVAEENIARVEEARAALVAYSALRADNSKRAKKSTKTNTTEKQFLQDID